MQCYHCGREVRQTLHWQKAFKVDYYLLHTGLTEWAYFVNPKFDAPPVRYRKLIQPTDIITCVDCYGVPTIRRRLEDDFTGRQPLFEIREENSATLTTTPRPDADG
jgi:hypothetical protein